MHRQEVKSKFLKSVGYDAEKKILEIEFLQTRKEDTRRVYQYFDVPMEKVLEMSTASSKGGYFLTMIKPNYKFVRVMEATNDENKTQEDTSKTQDPPTAPKKGA
jgi:hypothetical protein